MTVYYTLKSGERLSMFFWDDYYLGKEVFHLPLEVTEIDMTSPGTDGYCYKTRKSIKYPGEMEACTHQRTLYEKDDVRYFHWKDEVVNIMDWDYHCIPMLCEEIEYAKQIKDRWFISKNIILSSLMKQPDKFAVMLQPHVARCRIPGTTICLMSSERVEEFIPYIPYIHSMREIKDWSYKIDLWPKDEQLRQICGHEEYYFDDFCQLLYNDILRLVEIDKGGDNNV